MVFSGERSQLDVQTALTDMTFRFSRERASTCLTHEQRSKAVSPTISPFWLVGKCCWLRLSGFVSWVILMFAVSFAALEILFISKPLKSLSSMTPQCGECFVDSQRSGLFFHPPPLRLCGCTADVLSYISTEKTCRLRKSLQRIEHVSS